MSAAVEHRPSNGGADVEEASTDQPVSRFTAVNGRSPPNSRPASKDPSPNPEQDKRQATHSREGSSHEVDHSRGGSSAALQASASPSNASKRKRSHSEDQSTESRRRLTPPHDHPNPYPALTNGTSEDHANDDSQLDERSDDATDPYGEHSDQPWQQREDGLTTDAQLAEALTRETQQHLPSHQMDSSPGQQFSPAGAPQPPRLHQPGDRGRGRPPLPPGTTAASLQKQRKRNFSNRTKTGCLTCRERKKKCDEGKPTCMNCQRGGFQCKGYSQGNSLYKAMRQQEHQPPPPIQAKNGIYERAGPHPYPARHMPGPEYYPGPPPPDGGRIEDVRSGRRTFEDDQRERLRIPNPQDPNIRTGMGRYQPADPYYNQHPPPQELLPRQEYPPLSQHLANMPHEQIAREQKQLPPPPQPVHPSAHTSSMGSIAQSALDHPSSRPPPPPPPTSFGSEREKMLNGVPFNPKDAQLKKDRAECAKAVYRFNNNATNPDNLSEKAKIEQFSQIIEAHRRDSGSPSTSNSPRSNSDKAGGRVGNEVEVDAPFFCEYGYNIRIGDGVEIGANCRIMDTSQVEIGARTIIGPDVKFLTVDGDHTQLRPPNAKRMFRAKRIVVGKDVFIGAGAIILPGTKIGDGATVGAGTVLKADINGPQTVCNNLQLRRLTSHWGQPPY